MKATFADTYYFLAFGNERDEGYQRAVQYAASYKGQILTTEWVHTEVADALASPVQRVQFLNLLQLVHNDSNWTVVEASHELFDRGIALFSHRQINHGRSRTAYRS
jgi:predicted nucleic acid-binding protein